MNTETKKEVVIDLGKLVAEREAKGLTQTELATALGFDRRQIWQFERGTGLTLKNAATLARFYKRPIEFFLAE